MEKKRQEGENDSYPNIRVAAENNEIEVIYYYLLKMSKVIKGPFNGTKLIQIMIYSSVASIGNYKHMKEDADKIEKLELKIMDLKIDKNNFTKKKVLLN